jgi:hypothetical protein
VWGLGLGFEGLGFWFLGFGVRGLGFGGLEIGFCGLGFVFAIWMLDLCLWFGCLLWLRVGIYTWGSGFDAWFGVWSLGFGIGIGFERCGVWNVRYKIWCLRVWGFGFWGFEGLGIGVWGSGDWVLCFGVCVCYFVVGFVIVVWIFVMAHGWNLHNHLTIKKSFQIMGQGVLGLGFGV